MKIQYISFDGEERQNSNEQIEYSKFNDFTSFKEYDLNIISLQNPNIWTYEGSQLKSVDCINDFISLNRQIQNAGQSKTLIVLPQNYIFYYYRMINTKDYVYKQQLKDCIPIWFEYILSNSLLGNRFDLSNCLFFDNSNTKIGDKEILSVFAFYFKESLTKSKGENCTTIRLNNKIFLTGLNFKQSDFDLDTFLMQIGLLIKNEPVPKWLNEYKILNDYELEKNLENEKERLLSVENKITEIQHKLQNNLYYKKALTASGDELVKIVFDMLEEMLSCDLSHFNDIKNEDFLIEKNGNVFIGEIKGVTTNVKSEYVSQLEVHYHRYIDNNPGIDIHKVKALLIISPFRTRDIAQRDPVHETQIQLAERNGSLIITTETLIKLFEKLQRHETDPDKIVELLMSKSGQLTYEDF